MYALLDSDGLFLCFDQITEDFCRLSPGQVRGDKALVDFRDGPVPTLEIVRHGQRESIPVTVGGAVEPEGMDASGRRGDVRAITIETRRLAKAAVTAADDGDVERFALIESQIANDLVSFCRDRWIVLATRRMLDFRTVAVIDGAIVCDGYRIDLESLLPFANAKCHKDIAVEIVVLRDGWKVDRLRRYRPAVVMVQFGDRALSMRMIKVLTTSLIEIGKFDGDMLAIGDQDRDSLEAVIHPAFLDNLMVSKRSAQSGLEFCMARWSLADTDALDGYQPILYLDTDVICDGALSDILIALTCADRIDAQIEYFNPAAEAESCGNFLFAQDPIPLDGLCGFCSGVVGIPNLYQLGAAAQLIALSTAAYVKEHGPHALLWNDQPVVNYVLRKLCLFEEGPVGHAVTIPERADEIVLAERKGFVHFWRAGGSDRRADEMEAYLNRLTDAQNLGVLPELRRS